MGNVFPKQKACSCCGRSVTAENVGDRATPPVSHVLGQFRVVHKSGCSEEEKAGKLAHLSKSLIILRRTCSQDRLVFIPKA